MRNGYTGDTEDMILAEDIEPYISEPDNIYDLAGNCFGLLSEEIADPVKFISNYASGKEKRTSNPNLYVLERFFLETAGMVRDYRPTYYGRFISRVREMIGKLQLTEYLDKKENELSVIYFLLSAIDAGARSWKRDKLFSGLGPLDRISKTGYRVYLGCRDTLISNYEVKVGRNRKQANDFSSQFDTFHFINMKRWKSGEHVPRIVYVPRMKNVSEKKTLRAAVIPGPAEENMRFAEIQGSSYRVEYSEIDQKTAVEKAANSLKKAIQNKCDIIVLPEYVVSPEVYEEICRQLRKAWEDEPECMPALIFSGTTWTDDDNNVMKILDSYGDEIGQYYKYSPFTKKKPGNYNFAQCEGLSDPGKYCDLMAVEGWGILLPAICRDVIDGEYTEEIVRLLLPFMVVISACSPSVASFTEPQQEMAHKYFTSSILANACCAVDGCTGRKNIGNAGIVHKNQTLAGIHIEDICRDDSCANCKEQECVYIIDFDFTYDNNTNTKLTISKA